LLRFENRATHKQNCALYFLSNKTSTTVGKHQFERIPSSFVARVYIYLMGYKYNNS